MTKLNEALGREGLTHFTENLGPFVTNDHIGVEIELEGFDAAITQVPPFWQLHTDGSLRNNGQEFVFASPLCGTQAYEALVSLEKMLKKWEAKISVSPRTSVHVHVNALDMQVEHLRRFIGLYCIFEAALFQAYAPSRKDNHFCTPLNESQPQQEYLYNWCRGLKFGVSKIRSDPGRYSAFNSSSLNKFGTIEFRHLHGEWRSEPLVEWINALLSLKKAAMAAQGSDYDFLDSLSIKGPIAFTREIFPEAIAQKLLNTEKLSEMFEGCRTFQNIITMNRKFTIPEDVKSFYKPKPPEFVPYEGTPSFLDVHWLGYDSFNVPTTIKKEDYYYGTISAYDKRNRLPKKVVCLPIVAYKKANQEISARDLYSVDRKLMGLIDWNTGAYIGPEGVKKAATKKVTAKPKASFTIPAAPPRANTVDYDVEMIPNGITAGTPRDRTLVEEFERVEAALERNTPTNPQAAIPRDLTSEWVGSSQEQLNHRIWAALDDGTVVQQRTVAERVNTILNPRPTTRR